MKTGWTRAGRSTAAALALLLGAVEAIAVDEIRLPQADGTELILQTPARRIITLAPHFAELMYAAGAGDLLLATVEYSDFPEEALALPRIGDAFRFDMERILALKPDLVIAWDSGNPSPALAQLNKLGLTTWRVEISTPDGIADIMDLMGLATGRAAPAELAAQTLRKALQDLRSTYRDRPPVSYFFQIAEQPLYTVNGTHLISQGLSICGARNVFHDLPTLAPQVTHESVILADPEALISAQFEGQSDPLALWHDWPRMKAVASGAYIYLPADNISRAGPRMLDGIELACNLLDELRQAKSQPH